jgi:P-type Cu2+ transporter
MKHSAFESAEKDHSGHSNYDHSSHAAHSPAIFKQRFWLSLILTIPVLL